MILDIGSPLQLDREKLISTPDHLSSCYDG